MWALLFLLLIAFSTSAWSHSKLQEDCITSGSFPSWTTPWVFTQPVPSPGSHPLLRLLFSSFAASSSGKSRVSSLQGWPLPPAPASRQGPGMPAYPLILGQRLHQDRTTATVPIFTPAPAQGLTLRECLETCMTYTEILQSSLQNLKKKKKGREMGLPWWLIGKQAACQCRQETQVQSLIQEDPAHRGATRPMHHSY